MRSKLNTPAAKDLSKLLIEARERLGLTQLQVAEKSGIHVQTYAGFEQGRLNPSWEKLYPVFKVLKIKLSF
ncbi:helix-turn-helix transcriptional regulator [Candidatus Daviesbacteria bacterium]|nr:helix-turn-helix transcriptional regulator [Candidatus Daviesbacteria bacterium]